MSTMPHLKLPLFFTSAADVSSRPSCCVWGAFTPTLLHWGINHSLINHSPSLQMRIVRSAVLAVLLDALAALKFGAAAALLWLCGRGAAARSLLGAWTVRKSPDTSQTQMPHPQHHPLPQSCQHQGASQQIVSCETNGAKPTDLWFVLPDWTCRHSLAHLSTSAHHFVHQGSEAVRCAAASIKP